MFFRKTKISLLILLILVLITHWRWVFLFSYFGWGDARWYLQFNETLKELFSLPELWNARVNGVGGYDLALSTYPTLYLLFGGLAVLGFDARLALKVLFLLPSPVFSLLGSYLLIKHLTKSHISGIVGAVVYAYNTHSLLTQSGAPTLSIAYSIAPLILFLFIRTLETKSSKLAVLTGLISFLGSAYEFRIFYIIAFILLFYYLFFLFFFNRPVKIINILKTSAFAFIPMLIVILLNLYWIAPFYLSGALRSNDAFNRGLFGDNYMSLAQSIALWSPWWTAGEGYANGIVQPILEYFWLIPIFAVLGFILNIKPVTAFFLFISLLGILLTKQSDKPFPGLYLWLYQHFPGFNAYREASKFFIILALGYSVLIGFFINWVWLNLTKGGLQIFAKYLLTSLILFIFLWNAKPLVNGTIRALFEPKQVLSEYSTVKDFIRKDSSFYRTIWFPTTPPWTYYDNNHFKLDSYGLYHANLGQKMYAYEKTKKLKNDSGSIPDTNFPALNLYGQDYSDYILDALSVKYVIIPQVDTINPEDDPFKETGFYDRNYVLNFFDKLSYLQKIDTGTKEIVVYENKDYKPRIYLTEEEESIFKKVTFTKLDFKTISSSEHKIYLKNLKNPNYLNFTESYDTAWTLYLGDFNFFTPWKNITAYPATKHSQTELSFNKFFLNPKIIKESFDKSLYTENEDGSINVELTLYLKDQSYIYLGLVVSVICLFSCLVLLIIPDKIKITQPPPIDSKK